MNRPILTVALSLLIISCSQNSSREPGSASSVSVDSSAQKELTRIDTTEIDFVKSTPDKTRVLLENEYVRVIEYSLKPGDKDNLHTHPPKTSYVISGGLLRVYPGKGKPFDVEEITGNAEWSNKVGKHTVENIGKTTVTILLTEIKSAKK